LDVFERQQIGKHHDPKSTQIPINEIVATVRQHRRQIVIITAIGMLVATIVAFVIPNEYVSKAQLMPPDPQTFSGTSALAALNGIGIAAPNLTSSLISQRTPGATAIAVLKSSRIQDEIVNQFDLRRVYNRKFYVDARKMLLSRSEFTEDKTSGIVSIAVTDRDPIRARDIAQADIEQLDKVANSLSTSSARRERVFLGQEITSARDELAASTSQLAQFSSNNATVDLAKQGEATVSAAGRLEAELITEESELSGLKVAYADDNLRVLEVRGRIAELQAQLHKMIGNGQMPVTGNVGVNQPLPSLRALPLLGERYYDLYRQVTMQEAILATLTKQYELAKVAEAKEIPSIKVLDPPTVPEKKSAPQRVVISLLGAFVSAFGAITWFTTRRFWGASVQGVTSEGLREQIAQSL
jgi:capsule polysaccharide export protein KpsE/RkpR